MKIWVKLLFIYLLLMLGIGYIFQMTCNHFKENTRVQRTIYQQTGYSSVLQANRILADTFFNEVINRDEILALVHQIIHSQGDEQNIQRGLLHRTLSAAYRRNKNDVADVLHFHFPDNRSMLRFHLPQKADDDLTQRRPSVAYVNTELKAVHSYESGRCLQAYRHVYPLVYQGEHIGSVEISQPCCSISHKVQQLEVTAHTQFIFIQKTKGLDQKLSRKDEEYYVSAELHPDYSRQKQISELIYGNREIEKVSAETLALFKKIKNNNAAQASISRGQDFSQYATLNKDIYSIVFHAVKNISDQNEGYFVAITPEPQIKWLVEKFQVYYFFTGLVLFGIFLYRGVLQTTLQANKKTQESLQAVFDNKLVGMVVLDSDGHYQQVNHHWQVMTGYSQEELLTMNFSELTHPADAKDESLFEQLSEKSDGHTLQLTKRYLCKDGRVFWGDISATGLFDDHNQFIGLVGMIVDVTERKQAEEDRERLLLAIDQSSETIVITDTQGTIQYANPAFEKTTGYTCTEAIGENPRILKSGEHGDAFYQEMWETLTHGELWKGRLINKKKDGTLYTEEATISPVLDASGKTVSYVAVKHDITAAIEQEQQLHRAQKMEAVGMMAGGVAHDLNNMLAGIINYPELMLRKLPPDSTLKKPLEAIRDSGQRAAAVVADLLTVARGVASPRQPYDLNQLIQEHLNSPECQELKTVHAGVTCTEQYDAEQPMIHCSVIHIQKAVMNLTLNAAEAVGDSGQVTISTGNRQINQAEGAEKDMEPGDYVVVTVQDNGSGIADKDLKHIFEPFYTKKTMGRSGTGLGLAVVWNTVEDHNGKIFVDSSPAGTRFQLYFPRCKTENIVPNETEKDENLTGHGEHILIVDDEPQLRDIASQMLQSLNYKVDSVSSGEQAIEFIRKTPVDLIVLDMLMEPGINGRQTYAEMIKHSPAQKAVIASGFSESDDVKMALQLGAGGFIGKPYSLEKLGRAVKDILND